MISAGQKTFGITNFLGRRVKLAALPRWCSERSNGGIKILPMLCKSSLMCWVTEGDVKPLSSKNGVQLKYNNLTWCYNFFLIFFPHPAKR